MKKINKRNIIKISLISIFIIYISLIFIKQQHILSSYKNEQKYLTAKIEEQNEYKNELQSIKENVDSDEYIEQIAREKLNMYLPNERLYIDVGN